jgi:hypothetical protein
MEEEVDAPRFSEALSAGNLSEGPAWGRTDSSVDMRCIRRSGTYTGPSQLAELGLRLGLSIVWILRCVVCTEGVLSFGLAVLLSTSCRAGKDEPRDAERSCLRGALVGPSYWTGLAANSLPDSDLLFTSLRAIERSGTVGFASGEGVLRYESDVGVKLRGCTST